MDKELQKLVNETIRMFFENAPEKMVMQGTRAGKYNICPHCQKEIYEFHEYTDDGGVTWKHSDCKGLINYPEKPIDEAAEWIRPYIKEARKWRRIQRKKKNMKENEAGLPPSGEEKYNKQEPEGPLAGRNVTTIANEVSKNVTTKEETFNLPVHDDANFLDRSVTILNASNVPLKAKVIEFSAMADDVHAVKKYFVRIENA